jgi:DNA-binding response OmpR family regulator
MGAKARILVIEHHEDSSKAIQRVLQRAGYIVSVACEGETGLQKACQEQPDLIILDITVHRVDGYEFCRRLKSQSDTAHIGILIFTGRGQLEDAESFASGVAEERILVKVNSFYFGALEFSTKPIRSKELVDRVKALLLLNNIEV